MESNHSGTATGTEVDQERIVRSNDVFQNSGIDVPENRRNVIGTADGSPVVVQTGTGIKVSIEVLCHYVATCCLLFLIFPNELGP